MFLIYTQDPKADSEASPKACSSKSTAPDVSTFLDRFRLSKASFQFILEEIEPLITLDTNRAGCIKPMEQLLLTLRFYASGNMQIAAADFMSVSKASACRTAIALLRPRHDKYSFDQRLQNCWCNCWSSWNLDNLFSWTSLRHGSGMVVIGLPIRKCSGVEDH
ncbi:hypothetical protein Trydic_g6799 [Trypoxylus dichotomus]